MNYNIDGADDEFYYDADKYDRIWNKIKGSLDPMLSGGSVSNDKIEKELPETQMDAGISDDGKILDFICRAQSLKKHYGKLLRFSCKSHIRRLQSLYSAQNDIIRKLRAAYYVLTGKYPFPECEEEYVVGDYKDGVRKLYLESVELAEDYASAAAMGGEAGLPQIFEALSQIMARQADYLLDLIGE